MAQRKMQFKIVAQNTFQRLWNNVQCPVSFLDLNPITNRMSVVKESLNQRELRLPASGNSCDVQKMHGEKYQRTS